MLKPIFETFKTGDLFYELMAFYLDYPSYTRGRPYLKFGKSKWRALLSNIPRFEMLLASADSHVSVYWPWDKHGREPLFMDRGQVGFIIRNQEVISNWANQ